MRHGTRTTRVARTVRPDSRRRPDGALYVTDDTGGRIYKIVYSGK